MNIQQIESAVNPDIGLLAEARERIQHLKTLAGFLTWAGKDFFSRRGTGTSEITIGRVFYILFFPVPLPCEYSTTKGRSWFAQHTEAYDAAKKGIKDRDARRDRGNVLQVIP